ncbi:MAG: nicotinate-nucleotide adenylyltransferase [Pyrinomonadaceae bacterium]
MTTSPPRKRIAFYGGSFDPIHLGHFAVAKALLGQFGLDEFVFIPASHAPHKLRKAPTSTYDRYAMLCLATHNESNIRVSRMEIEMPDRPYSVETLSRLNEELSNVEIFFVMGADSWTDITTWREWEKVLSLSNHIVVSRPGYQIGTGHVTDDTRLRIVDLRGQNHVADVPNSAHGITRSIYFTDSVNYDVSATDIRRRIRENDDSWQRDVPIEVANYIEKYQIYK